MAKNAHERCIITTDPYRTSRDVRSNGYASATMPTVNASAPHVHGTRNAGRANMQNPVAMPMGGATIFFIDTALRPSRTRQIMMAANPTTEPAIDVPAGMWMNPNI